MRLRKPLVEPGLRHLRESWKIVLAVGAAALMPLILAVIVGTLSGVNFSFFTRDPLAVAKAPVHLGFVSNLGVMIWTAGAALALSGGYRSHAGTRKGELLLALGWLMLLLAADDMFMLHDLAHIHLGIDATFIYGVLTLVGTWRYRRVLIRQTNVLLFLLAFGGLGMSAAIDGTLHAVGLSSMPGAAFIEDCFKFLGICFWTTFAWREAAPKAVAPAPTAARAAMAAGTVTPAPAFGTARAAMADERRRRTGLLPAEDGRKA